MVPSLFARDASTYPPNLRFVKELEEGMSKSWGERVRLTREAMRHGLRLKTVARIVGYALGRKLGRYEGFDSFVALRTLKLDIHLDIYEHLVKQSKLYFTSFYLNQTDAFGHLFWRYYEPECFPNVSPGEVQKYGDMIPYSYEMADRVFVVKGTDAHTGKDGRLENLFAHFLDNAVPDPVEDNPAWWWVTGKFGGLQVDICHSTTMGGRPWTEMNGINYLSSDVLQRYAERNDRPPDLAIRGHVHRHFDTYDNKRVRAITLPCWKLTDSFGHKKNPNRMAHIGAMAFVIENGNIVKGQKWITEQTQYPKQHYRRQL